MVKEQKIIGVAFGDPMSYKTFSGYSRHFFEAAQSLNCLHSLINTKDIRIEDIFRYGAINFKRVLNFQKPNISAHWLWKPSTINLLSQRLQDKLKEFDENIPVIQVGTQILPCNTNRKFYCITDMTILQAAKAGQFKIKELDSNELKLSVNAQKKMFDSYEKIFVLCKWTKNDIVENYDQPENKVIVIGAGANIEQIEPAQNKYRSKEILFIGYDWLRKGGPLLLDAFRLLKKSQPNAVLNIVGYNPEIDEDGVKIYGRLNKAKAHDRDILINLFKTANSFCILPDFDPFPNVLLEAQKAFTPVVSILDGSRAEAVINGITGILVEQKTPKSVAEAFIKIFSDEQYAKNMGNSGNKHILDNFTWDKVALKVLNNL